MNAKDAEPQTHMIMRNNEVVRSVTGYACAVPERMETEREVYYRTNIRNANDNWHIVSVPL